MEPARERDSKEQLLQIKAELAAQLRDVPHLRHITARLQREVSLPRMMREALESAIKITRADFGTLQLLDTRSGALKIVAQHGFEQDFLDFFSQVHTGRACCGSAMQRGARVIVEDVHSDAVFADAQTRRVVLQAGVRAVQSTPLLNRDRKVLGVIATHYRVPQTPAAGKLRRLDSLVRHTAGIVETAQVEGLLRRLDEMVTTAELTSVLAHEINNPLQSMTNLLELLSQHQATEEARAWLELARQELKRIVQTAHRVLTESRTEPASMLGQLPHPQGRQLAVNRNCNLDEFS